MKKSTYWAKAPLPRQQMVLIQRMLDDVISGDHPARVFDEILQRYDWAKWEVEYHGFVGQPPIHPRILAGLWLYGIRRGIRSSRKLEYMVGYNLDFKWLAYGHQPDHSTLSNFRTKFKQQLKDLFKHVVNVALAAGLAQLAGVASDGTHVQANANRFETWTQENIQAEIAKLAAEFNVRLEESARLEEKVQGQFLDETLPEPEQGQAFAELGGGSESVLPPELADIQARQKKLREIQEQLKAADLARAKEGIDTQKNPAQIPVHDTDSRIMPNKEGGFAPNYTPIATTDSHGGFILDVDVINSASDSGTLLPSVDRIKAEHGEYPECGSADGAYASGPNIRGMEERGIEFFSNLPTPDPATNPAVRPNTSEPVPESKWIELPICRQTKKLDKACFVYDAEHDIYRCPLGQSLEFECHKSDMRRGEKRERGVYRCESCDGCPLREKCVSSQSKSGRTVTRDAYTDDRARLAVKMRDPANQQIYNQRMHIAEKPFALIKHVIGLRQFLLRGLENVKTEWQWTCLSVNLDKLVRGLMRLRSELAAMVAAEAN